MSIFVGMLIARGVYVVFTTGLPLLQLAVAEDSPTAIR